MTVLDEAATITSGSRLKDYGHPLDNFTDTANLWNVLLRKKLAVPLTADDAILMMVAVKLAREIHTPKYDNALDIAGYARCLEMIQDERKKREGAEGPNGSSNQGT